MSGALLRYRAISYIVGVALILLVVVGMPLKYIWGEPFIVATVGRLHGFLYMVFLLATFDLGRRANWTLGRMVKFMLMGTVPFVSFYAERVATRQIEQPSQTAQPERVATR